MSCVEINKICNLGFELPPYSIDLATSDYYLLAVLFSNKQVMEDVESWIADREEEFF